MDGPKEQDEWELERALAHICAHREGELEAMAPRFEQAFREGVEQRIWQSAKQRPGLWRRLGHFRHWWAQRRRVSAAGFGLAAAVVLALVAFQLDRGAESGMAEGVTVDGVSFEGTVTVMPEGDVTVMWLTDAPPPS